MNLEGIKIEIIAPELILKLTRNRIIENSADVLEVSQPKLLTKPKSNFWNRNAIVNFFYIK